MRLLHVSSDNNFSFLIFSRIAVWIVLGFLLTIFGNVPQASAQTLEPEAPPQSNGLTQGSSGQEAAQAVTQALFDGIVSATAIINQTLIGNHFEEGSVGSHTSLENSIQNNSGIVSVNQSSGSLNNQGNVRVLALANAESVLQDLALSVATVHRDNTVVVSGAPRNNRIVNSFEDSNGIVGVNQSAGNLNQQANVLVLGLGGSSGSDPTVYQLDDENLGEVNSNNKVTGPIGARSDVIANSFTNFSGVAQVSQSAGDLNVVRNSIGLSFSASGQP